jgi:uncharacterized protein YqgC (DUF456 family)
MKRLLLERVVFRQKSIARPIMRLIWLGSGLVCTGLGFLGIVLPVVPATPFFFAGRLCFCS